MTTPKIPEGLIYNAEGRLDVNAMRTNGTLSHEDYIKWDTKMVDVARTRLTFVQDLIDNGLANFDFDLGDIVSKYEKLSDMEEANVDMDAATGAQKDRLVFTESGVPIPIFHKGFTLNERQIIASRRKPGGNLPSTQIVTATRLVADKLENMVPNGVTGLVLDNTQIYGYTTHPNRNTHSIAHAWGSSSSADPEQDVLDMLAKAYADNFFGPFNLYVSKDNWGFIQKSRSASSDITFKKIFENMSDITAVRPGDKLADGELVLVQMSEDVVDLAVAQDIVNFEEPLTSAMQHDFTVMAAMAVRVKSDSAGKCGVVHATGA